MARLTSQLYKLARTVNTLGALTSGDSRRAGRRVKNLALGRMMARGGFWRWLWGGRK